MTAGPVPEFSVGVNLRSIDSSFEWWLTCARRLESAGYAGAWIWDHFVSRGVRSDSVLEAWTTLTGVAAGTDRIELGTYVTNVMNRHPAVLARMAATFQEISEGRLVLGMGIGGHPAEHEAYGIPFPAAPERVARLEEAVGVIRALWTGGPVSRPGTFYSLAEASAHPIPRPLPRIIIGGETTGGARLAARVGDGWTTYEPTFRRDYPIYLEALELAGKTRARQRVLVGFELAKGARLADSAWIQDPSGMAGRWQAAGADGVVLSARTTADVDALVGAAERR